MGKYILQYVIPAAILLPLAWVMAKRWFLKRFPKSVNEHIKIVKASEKYDEKLGKS